LPGRNPDGTEAECFRYDAGMEFNNFLSVDDRRWVDQCNQNRKANE
jgi:hypothetical protein